jgi:hypothetical protein
LCGLLNAGGFLKTIPWGLSVFMRPIISFCCFGWFAAQSFADEPAKYKPIDAETIAAYEKLGAQ